MRTAIVCGALALAVTTAVAQTNVWEDGASASFMLPGCKAALTNQINRPLTDQVDGPFLAGMCLGYIRAIGMFTATPRGSRLCADIPGVTSEEMVRVVVRYIEARPQRMNEPFIWLATSAVIDAWPCPK
jgi:hypothetical protein